MVRVVVRLNLMSDVVEVHAPRWGGCGGRKLDLGDWSGPRAGHQGGGKVLAQPARRKDISEEKGGEKED